MLNGKTLHNDNLEPHGIEAVRFLQLLKPFITLTCQPFPHFTQTAKVKNKKPASTESNYSMGHLFFTLLWIWDGSAHKRTIQGLQTSRQTAPVPFSACLLSAWRGRVSYWTHAATVSPEKGEQIQLQWGDYVLIHCASTVQVCLSYW